MPCCLEAPLVGGHRGVVFQEGRPGRIADAVVEVEAAAVPTVEVAVQQGRCGQSGQQPQQPGRTGGEGQAGGAVLGGVQGREESAVVLADQVDGVGQRQPGERRSEPAGVPGQIAVKPTG